MFGERRWCDLLKLWSSVLVTSQLSQASLRQRNRVRWHLHPGLCRTREGMEKHGLYSNFGGTHVPRDVLCLRYYIPQSNLMDQRADVAEPAFFHTDGGEPGVINQLSLFGG